MVGRDRMAKSPPFPFVLHPLILVQGAPARLTYHQQFPIIITVTKALIEEELEEEGSLLIQLLADKTPILLLLLHNVPILLSLVLPIPTFYPLAGFVSSDLIAVPSVSDCIRLKGCRWPDRGGG